MVKDIRAVAERLSESILMERNVANMGDVERILKNALEHVSHLDARETNKDNIVLWIKSNLRNWLITEYGDEGSGFAGAERIVDPQRYKLPDWMFKKAPGGDIREYLKHNEVFWLQIDPEFEQQLIHVLDYLSMMPHGKDLKRYQVPIAMRDAVRWGQQQAKKAAENEKTNVDSEELKREPKSDLGGTRIKLFLKFPDGMFWVEFMHAEDKDYPELAREIPKGTKSESGGYTVNSSNPLLRRETYYMNHCVGSGYGYGEMLRTGTTRLFSLRNKNNRPCVTVQISNNKTIAQCYAKNNVKPKSEFWEYIKVFANHGKFKFPPGEADSFNFIETANGYISATDMKDYTPEQIAALKIEKTKLRKLGFITVGNTVMPINEMYRLNRKQLDDSDLTNEELSSNGFIRAVDGKVRLWSEMAGQTVKGTTTFNHPNREIEFAQDITFENVVFDGYNWDIEVPFTVMNDLTIRGGRISSIAPGMQVGKNFKIISAGGGNIKQLTDFTCKSMEVTDTSIKSIRNATITGELKQNGSGIEEIGPGCSIGRLNAANSNLKAVHPSLKVIGGIEEFFDVSGCPITELLVTNFPNGLKATNSKLRALAPNTKIGKVTTVPALILDGCPISELPENLEIDGGVLLPATIKSLPRGFVAKSLWIPANGVNYYPRHALINRTILVRPVGNSKTASTKIYTVQNTEEHHAKEPKLANGNHIPGTRPLEPGDVNDGGSAPSDAPNAEPKNPAPKKRGTKAK